MTTSEQLTINFILDHYYPNTFSELRFLQQEKIIRTIGNRYVDFDNLAKEYNMTLKELLDKVHNETEQFPFAMSENRIIKILKT
jgi:hypothetical protein